MEDILLRLMDDSTLHLNAAAIIKASVFVLLTVAMGIALNVLYKRLKKSLVSKNESRKLSVYRVAFRVARIFLIVIAVIAVLQAIGVNMIGLSAILGIAAVLVVLAVKDALQDVFAGVVIMTDKYFNVGDAVEYNGMEGIVKSFSARTTKIEVLADHSVISVANRNISEIRKFTHLVDIDLPLPYELSGRDAFTLLKEICGRIGKIEGVENCEFKGTQDFGASAVIYKIRFYCEPKDKLDIRRAVLKTIQDGLEENDIRIPYQQIDIHEKQS